MKKCKYSLILLIFALAIKINLPDFAMANGAAWSPGVQTGTPHPVQQNDLILEKEHVLIKDGKITAKFWVYNPKNVDIKILIGFPVVGHREDLMSFEILKEHLLGDALEFSVTSDKQKLDTELLTDFKNEYPIVYTWEMAFPAKKTTEFTVEYKYLPEEGTDGATIGSHSINYITHTGSFWAAPIMTAKFKYCNAEVVDFFNNYDNGKFSGWIDNGDAELTFEATFYPEPYVIDLNKKCIIWQRENWKPKAQIDDIKINIFWNKKEYIGEDGFIRSRERFFKGMCKHKKGTEQSIKFSGERVNEDKLLEILFNEINRQIYTFESKVDPKAFPEHIKTDLQLLVLRYFRNYIFALHGYNFKDEKFASCFKSVPQKKEWLEVEKENMDTIIKLEKKIEEENKVAWDKVKAAMKKYKNLKIPSIEKLL